MSSYKQKVRILYPTAICVKDMFESKGYVQKFYEDIPYTIFLNPPNELFSKYKNKTYKVDIFTCPLVSKIDIGNAEWASTSHNAWKLTWENISNQLIKKLEQ